MKAGIAVLFVGVLIGAVVVLPRSFLFAQDASPVATEIPYDQLPECVIVTPNPLTPTAIPDPNAFATCRVAGIELVDAKEPYEQGQDLGELGFGGDPRSMTQEPGSSAVQIPGLATATPYPDSASVQVPNQTYKTYIPSVESSPSQVNPTAAPSPQTATLEGAQPGSYLE